MNISKWRVERQRKGCWAAYDPVYGYAVHPWTFDTHAEALAHADEQARTVTVTLPRDPEAREVARAGEWTSWKGNGWGITTNDPERAALNILAYYHRKARA